MSEKTVAEKVLEIFNKGWNKQVILYGPPGTSKTYSATIIAAKLLGMPDDKKPEDKKDEFGKAEEFLKGNPQYKLVQFHPSYSYEDFVRGITMKTDGDKVSYPAEAKNFEKICIEAMKAWEETDEKKQAPKYVLVIDEINRAPLASVLGELIYGLEYRGKSITVPYEKTGADGNPKPDGDKITIPENLYIIGTMNTADRSIGSIDYAVRRRFAFVHVPSEPLKIEGSWEYIGGAVKHLYKELMNPKTGIFGEEHNLLEDQEMDVEDIKIGHTYFLGKKKDESQEDKPSKEDERAYMDYRIDYQIKPIYMEYIKDGLIKKEGKDIFKGIIDEWRAGKGAIEPESK